MVNLCRYLFDHTILVSYIWMCYNVWLLCYQNDVSVTKGQLCPSIKIHNVFLSKTKSEKKALYNKIKGLTCVLWCITYR